MSLAPLLSPISQWLADYIHVEVFSPNEVWKLFGSAFVLWSLVALWAFRKYTKADGDEYASRVVSLLHAVVSSVLCGFAALEGYHVSDSTYGVFGMGTTGLQQIALVNTAGYFTMDFIGILVNSYFSWLFIGHHLVSGGVCLYVPLVCVHGYESCMAAFLMEVSNPCFHGRWLLIGDGEHKKNRGRGTWLYRQINRLWYVTYFVARVVGGPILTYQLVIADNTPLLFKACGIVLQVLSITFMFEHFPKGYRGEVWR